MPEPAGMPAWRRLVAEALSYWGREPHEVRLVKQRENAVFRVVDGQGDAFALRVHRRGYHSDGALRSELQWMAALQAAGVHVPTLVPTSRGDLFVTLPVDSPADRRQIDLFEWIDGRPLGTSEDGLAGGLTDVGDTYRIIGATMARLHRQACTWQLPADFVRHCWDREALVGEQPLWGRFWELDALRNDERALLVQARSEVQRGLAQWTDRPGAEGFGLIHADFVPENILVGADGRLRVIDFDDAGFGWHLFDLATALYFIQDDPAYAQARDGLVAGYRSERALPDEWLAQLPLFMTARGFTYLGWVHTRATSSRDLDIVPHLVRLACRQATALMNG